MKVLGPTRHSRLNEGLAVVYLLLGLCYVLCLVSYHQQDPSLNTATSIVRPLNLIGRVGASVSDFSLQSFGLAAFAIPVLLVLLSWKWLRSESIDSQFIKIIGALALVVAICTLFSLGPQWRPFSGSIAPGGLIGVLLADYLTGELNPTGAILFTAAVAILSLYLVSTFSLAMVGRRLSGPAARWQAWRERRRQYKAERAEAKARFRQERKLEAARIAATAQAPIHTEPERVPRARRAVTPEPASAPIPEPAPVDEQVAAVDFAPPFQRISRSGPWRTWIATRPRRTRHLSISARALTSNLKRNPLSASHRRKKCARRSGFLPRIY